MHNQLNPARVRPTRLTFGRVCIWCGTTECRNPDCVARHRRSHWMPCPDCAGTLTPPDTLQPCGCLYGVIEATPAGCAR